MARQAGPKGVVLGIDPEERLLRQAREEATRQGLKAEFRVGDVDVLQERGEFDLVYTRFLLSHREKGEAEHALRCMMRVIQPGGTIVLEDLDCSHGPDANGVDNPAYSRFLELFNALVHDEGAESRHARKLPELLQRAGVASVQVQEMHSPTLDVTEGHHPASLILDSIRHAVVAAQIATRTEVDRLSTELDRFGATCPGAFFMPRIVQAWGSVPAGGG